MLAVAVALLSAALIFLIWDDGAWANYSATAGHLFLCVLICKFLYAQRHTFYSTYKYKELV